MNRYSEILRRLDKVRAGKDGRTWTAICPAHDDNKPSLFLFVGRNGQLQAQCQAGCNWESIVRATRTEPQDWFPEEDRVMSRGAVAEERKIEAKYDYHDEKGNVLYQVVRYHPKDFRQRRLAGGTCGKTWVWDMQGVRKVLYNLPLIVAKQNHPVVVVEGEKDADRLTELGLIGTTNVGGSGKWLDCYSLALKGRKVAIIPDEDNPGQEHAMNVAGSLLWHGAESVRLVKLPGLCRGQDVSDWLMDCLLPHQDPREQLIMRIKQAREWK